MGKKYPTPSEARRNFVQGIDLSKEKWATRAKQGADDYELWFTGFANELYPLIATLPERTGDINENIDNRCKPVAKAIHRLSVSYQRTKLEEITKKVAAVITPAAR